MSNMMDMGHRRIARRRNGERGTEFVEFAFVLPLLLVVVLGIVDFGFLFQRYEVITNAAREGVRIAVRPGTPQTEVENIVTGYVQAVGLTTSPTNPVIVVSPTTITVGPSNWPTTTVDVTYTHDYIFVGNILSLVCGSLGSAALQVRATMRDETAGGSWQLVTRTDPPFSSPPPRRGQPRNDNTAVVPQAL